MEDPVFLALVQRQREDLGHDQDRFCTQCHSAIGTRSGDVMPGFTLSALSPVSREGVTCESCHRVTGLERPSNSGHIIDPNAPAQGPFADAKSSHLSAHSPLLASSAFCGGCHDVQDPQGLVLESPYAEWMQSPAAESGSTCQTCHMPTYEGRATNLPHTPQRARLHHHDFTGVDDVFARELDDVEAKERRERSLTLLRSAMELDVSVPGGVVPGRALSLRVVVRSLVDGHRVPTGSSFFRQFWVDIEVSDRTQRLLYASGMLDERADLYDAHHPDRHVDPNLMLLGRTLRDIQGEPTLLPWRAVSVEDTTIAPLAELERSHDIAIPKHVQLPITVRARIRFRGFAPRLLREVGLDDHVPQLHVVDIDTKELVVNGAEP
jgi:hypothetical protein